MITWLQYVTHDKVESYLALGWVVDNHFSEAHHGEYSQLLKWVGEGEPPQPAKVAA